LVPNHWQDIQKPPYFGILGLFVLVPNYGQDIQKPLYFGILGLLFWFQITDRTFKNLYILEY